MSKRHLEKSLYQLEKEFPSEILPPEKLPLVGRENDFAKIPLKDFTAENLRFMIQQGFGWKVLIPLAVDILSENPFASGDRYDGDLLQAVLSVDEKFWLENVELWQKIKGIAEEAESIAENFLVVIAPELNRFRKYQNES